ncbi:MAG: HD domain-containing protein [Gemmatimonadales bacterium]
MNEIALPSWAIVSEKRRAHIERVAKLIKQWASLLDISVSESARWLRAAYFHDALKDATPEQLEDLAPEEWKFPKLRHGPAAASAARLHGEDDLGVLDAVYYHSIGYTGWDEVGRMLYMADFLEPGRKFSSNSHRELVELVPQNPQAALFQVTKQRVKQLAESGWPIPEETRMFWNEQLRSR